MQKKDNTVLEDNFKSLFLYSPQPMWVIDADNLNFYAVNKTALMLYGYSEKEFLSLKISDLIHSSAFPSSAKDIKSRLSKKSFTDIHFGKSGRQFVVEVKTSKILFNGSSAFLAVLENLEDIAAKPETGEEKEGFHAHVLSQITEAVVVFSIEGKIIFWNNGAERVYGYLREEAIDKTAEEIFRRTKGSEEDDDLINSSLVTMGEWKSLDIHRRKDGEKIFVESTTKLMRGSNNEITGIISLLRNVTDRIKAEEELRRSKEELNVILRSVADGITVQDLSGTLVYANDSAAQMCGFSNAKELLSAGNEEVLKRFYVMDEDGVPLPADKLPGRLALKGVPGASAIIKYKTLGMDNEGWSQVVSSPVFDENGNVRLAINVLHDITEQRKAEEEIRLSEERFRLLVDQSPLSKQIISPEGFTIMVNKSWEKLFGAKIENIYNINIFEDPQLIETGIVLHMKKALEGEASFLPPFKYYIDEGAPGGREVWVQAYIYPLKNNDGSIREIVLIHEDITERKIAQLKFEQEYAFRQGIENSIPEGIAVIDLEGKQSYVNPAFCRMLGWQEEELLNKYPPFVYWPEDEADTINKAFKHALAGNIPPSGFELKFMKRNGEKVDVQLQLSSIKDSGNKITGLLTSISDITARKKQEEILRKSEEKYRTLIEGTNAVLFTTNTRGVFTYANEAAVNILDLSMEEIIGKQYLKFVHPEDREMVHMKYSSRLTAGEDSRYMEFRYINGKGKEGWVSFLVSPVVENGVLAGMSGIAQDITERKMAEEKIAASLKEKEILLKEVHHRVKNNMQIIYSLLNLQSNTITDSKSLDAFKESQNRIRTMALIHEKLYQSKELSKIDLSAYVKELVFYLVGSYILDTDRIKVKFEIADVEVSIDVAISLGLIINELVTNSLKYAFPDNMKGELNIILQIHNSRLYRLTISDDGIGMPDGVNLSNSTSLGLQLVNTLVEQLNGQINLNTQHGTSFILTFPPSKK
ncbi:MAG: PAS domain S-box protein [Ignavibacteriaceae bacterium]